MRIDKRVIRKMIVEEASKILREGRRGHGGGYDDDYGGGGDRAMIRHIMKTRGVDYDEADQILADIKDDIGFDPDLVHDAVYGGGHDDDY